MTPLEIRAFVLRWLSTVSTGNHDEFSDLVADQVLDLNSGAKTSASAFEARAQAVRDAFGELRAELEELLLDGERIAWRWRISGVHRAPFLGQPASGQRVTLRGVNFQRLANGRVIEHYTLVDTQQTLSEIRAALATRGH